MGTEINSGGNEDEKINEDDIIENDCYEEIDMRKINQIIEKEKNTPTKYPRKAGTPSKEPIE